MGETGNEPAVLVPEEGRLGGGPVTRDLRCRGCGTVTARAFAAKMTMWPKSMLRFCDNCGKPTEHDFMLAKLRPTT